MQHHRLKQSSVLPGFGLSLGYALLYLSLVVLIPLAVLFVNAGRLSWPQFHSILTDPEVKSAFEVSFLCSLAAAVVNAVAYVRPHDIEILPSANGRTFPARVETVSFGGSVVYVELARQDTGETILATIPRQRWDELDVGQRSDVNIAIRAARVFSNDYSI